MRLPPPTYHLLQGTLPISYFLPGTHTQRGNYKETDMHILLLATPHTADLCFKAQYLGVHMHEDASGPTIDSVHLWIQLINTHRFISTI